MRADEIRELVELVERSGIEELEIRHWWRSVRIAKRARELSPFQGAAAPAPSPASVPGTAGAPPAAPAAVEEGLVSVVSPMVGTFYRASSPSAPPYVELGGRVSAGQVVCIVEAMKLMNEIESEVSGEIVKILVENGEPVEFNQPLFQVRPD